MEEVPNYGLMWLSYLAVACVFLGFTYWKSRRLKPWLQIPILSFIAAMAFAPATTIPGESWWSPAAIVMIFEIDQSGFAGFWRSGLSIIVLWFVFMITGFVGRWWWQKRQSASKSDTPDDTQLTADESTSGTE